MTVPGEVIAAGVGKTLFGSDPSRWVAFSHGWRGPAPAFVKLTERVLARISHPCQNCSLIDDAQRLPHSHGGMRCRVRGTQFNIRPARHVLGTGLEKAERRSRLERRWHNTNGQMLDSFPLTLRQKRLLGTLLERDETSARAYAGALKVLADDENPDRLALAAHNLRQLVKPRTSILSPKFRFRLHFLLSTLRSNG